MQKNFIQKIHKSSKRNYFIRMNSQKYKKLRMQKNTEKSIGMEKDQKDMEVTTIFQDTGKMLLGKF